MVNPKCKICHRTSHDPFDVWAATQHPEREFICDKCLVKEIAKDLKGKI